VKVCPNCQEETISLQWVLFNKSPHPDGKCFQCPNCGTRVKKSKWFIFNLLSADLLVEGTWILITTAFLGKLFGSYGIAFSTVLLVWAVLHFAVEYLAPLKAADEGYCRGDMTKAGAFFALIFMAAIIGTLLYCFIIQPFIMGKPFCG
jgi:hypothetical protein